MLRIAVVVFSTLVIWQILASLLSSPLLVPSPSLVWGGFVELWQSGELLGHLLASLSRLIVGLLVGVPLGVVIGCAMGQSWVMDSAFNPFVRVFNAIPAISLVPFSLIWLGVTEWSRYALLTYTITLTVLLSARQGVRTVPALRVKAAATLGVGGLSAFFRVTIPSCFPAILAGIRTALGLGVMVIVAAEMLGAESGFGYLIMQARSHFNISHMLVGIIGLGVLSLVLDQIFVLTIEKFLPRWSAERRIR